MIQPTDIRPWNPHAKRQTSEAAWLTSSVGIIEGSGSKGEKQRPFNYDRACREMTGWVYAAIMLNAKAFAGTPLRLYSRKPGVGTKRLWATRGVPVARKSYLTGQSAQRPSTTVLRKAAEFGDDFEEVVGDHPLLMLLRNVNPFLNGYGFALLRSIYVQATGNAWIHHVENRATGLPETLWPMPSQWVKIIPSRTEFVAGYVYGKGTENEKVFTRDEIIHFKTPNPRDLYYGLGVIEAGWPAINMNDAIHSMDTAMFDNNMRPDYLAIAKNASQESVDRFVANTTSLLRGTHKRGRMLGVAGDIDIKPLGWPPKDMAGRDEVVEEIAAVIGVPITLLKANDPNLASAKTGFATWKENTVLPMLTQDEQELNQSLVPLFGIEGDAFLAYDNPVATDRVAEVDEVTRKVAGGIMTPNEARALDGYEPAKKGDELYVNGQVLGYSPFAGLAGAGSRFQDPRPVDEPEPDEDEDEEPEEDKPAKSLGELTIKVVTEQSQSIPMPYEKPTPEHKHEPKQYSHKSFLMGKAHCSCHGHEHGTRLAKFMDGRGVKSVGAMSSALEEIFAAIRRDLLAVNNAPAMLSALPEILAARADAITNAIFGEVQASMQTGIKIGAAMLPEAATVELMNPQIEAYLDKHVLRLVGEIQDSTLEAVKDAVRDAARDGLSGRELANRIEDTGAFSPARAEMIARTETAQAYVEGEQEAWRQSDVVEGKRWLLAPDACEFCQAAALDYAETTVALDKPFYRFGDVLQGTEGGSMKLDYRDITGPPLHPHDRCDLVPVLREE